jgi:hypothetical protein
MRDDEFPARLRKEFLSGAVAIVAVLLAAAVKLFIFVIAARPAVRSRHE